MVQQAKNEVHVGDGESPMTSAQNLRLNRAIIDFRLHRHCTAERFFASSPPYHVCKGTRRSNGHGGVCFTSLTSNLDLLLAFTLLSTFLSCAPTIIVWKLDLPKSPRLLPLLLLRLESRGLLAWKAAVAPLLSFSHVALVSWLLLLSTSQSTRVTILMVHLPLRA